MPPEVEEWFKETGRQGGRTAAENLTPEERSERARKAAIARWSKAAPQPEEERIEFARQGGLVGGKARAKKLTPEQRSEIARKAAQARWAKRKAPDSDSGE